MPKDPLQSTLELGRIDDILRYLDSLELVVNSQREDVSASINNFGVFSLEKRPSATLVDDLNIASSATGISNDSQSDGDYEYILDPCPGPMTTLPNESLETEAAWNLCNLHGQQFAACFSPEQALATPNSADPVLPEAVQIPQRPSENATQLAPLGPGPLHGSVGVDCNPSKKAHQDLPPPRNIPSNPTIAPQERFLMSHYSNRVVNLFCVIDNAKSPWKTIHLPRVLQCAGELSFGVTTTRIRDALRNSILSISAFYLSNDHRANHRTLEAETWGTVASRHRCDAIGLLKYAVETDLYADRRPKYKEFLATMLSMITINVCPPFAVPSLVLYPNLAPSQVMSGDTSTCNVHLDGAERLISHMNVRKSTFSRKAKSLHRIYLYLRVIYESTAVRSTRTEGSRFSPSLDCSKTFGPEPIVQNHNIYIEDETTPLSTLPVAGDVLVEEGPLPGLSSYECIYGIPLCLLLLLKETIEVIDRVQSLRTNAESLSIPDPLNRTCDDLEQKIMDWPLEERLHRYENSTNGTSVTIIYHQTRAFLNALIIFFSQGVRSMGHRYLRQYVHKILDSIEAIEQLKAETKVLAAPLFWPAFMGATEAFEPIHQERFRRWYARVEIYGIEAARTGIKVVHEVWRQGPATYREMNSGWRGVVSQREECLMLT